MTARHITAMKYEIIVNGVRRSVEFTPQNGAASRVAIAVDGRVIEANAIRIAPDTYSILIGGRSLEVTLEENSSGLLLRTGGREFQAEIIDPRAWRSGRGGGIELEGRQQLVAPMPGKIVRVLVAAGQQVESGQGLLVMEAMKMQNEVRSPKSGTVEKVVKEGQTVNAGEILAVVA
jgi:acetyl/propionyl-CoA carboxylase alpha subunit